MKDFKSDHLKEYVNIRKLIAALQFIKKSGHKEYQFEFETSVDNYLERCKQDFEASSPDDDDNSSSSSNNSSRNSNSEQFIDSSMETDSFEKSSEASEENISPDDSVESDQFDEAGELEKLPKLVKKEVLKPDDDEAEYLKLDPAGRFQFNYNRVTGLSNNYPEIYVRDQPHTIAPGEGNKRH